MCGGRSVHSIALMEVSNHRAFIVTVQQITWTLRNAMVTTKYVSVLSFDYDLSFIGAGFLPSTTPMCIADLAFRPKSYMAVSFFKSCYSLADGTEVNVRVCMCLCVVG